MNEAASHAEKNSPAEWRAWCDACRRVTWHASWRGCKRCWNYEGYLDGTYTEGSADA